MNEESYYRIHLTRKKFQQKKNLKAYEIRLKRIQNDSSSYEEEREFYYDDVKIFLNRNHQLWE